jgi:hypothetical protein
MHMLNASSVTSPREDSTVVCRHCGAPSNRRRAAGNGSFCCDGCEAVFTLLQNKRLDAFYEYDVRPGVSQGSASP